MRERELGEGLPIFLADKKTKNPERLQAIKRNCRKFARQSSTIEPVGRVLYRFGDTYEPSPII